MFTAEKKYSDIVIVGAGLTGLRAAVAALEQGRKVTVLSKGPRCSAGVIGFNASIDPRDSHERFYQDIIASGQGLSQPELARLLADTSDAQVTYLEHHGLHFDMHSDGTYDLLCPLGCSVPRLVHEGTITGADEEKIFLKEIENMGGEVYWNAFVLDLLSDGEKVYGAMAVIDGVLTAVTGSAVVMAAGGGGGLYPVTVYPRGISGDSYAISARAGSEMVDMEFIQFEPCCLTEPEHLCGKGISTTLLNAGAQLLNAKGETFLHKYFDELSKMQKGELSRAIFAEATACGGPCFYDLREVPEEEIKAHCLFYKQLMAVDMNPKTTLLPIMPAAHTFLGGVKVDGELHANVRRLFAAGENLGGLHGANRIGGCAGSETISFGTIAGVNASKLDPLSGEERSIAEELIAGKCAEYGKGELNSPETVDMLLAKLRETVGSKLNLIREEEGLKAALLEIERLSTESDKLRAADTKELVQLAGLKNMLLTAKMIAQASLMRKESRGVFFRSDYPQKDPAWEKSIVLKMR